VENENEILRIACWPEVCAVISEFYSTGFCSCFPASMIMHDGGQMCVKCALVNFYIPSMQFFKLAHSSKTELFADIFRAIAWD
jgi:hypothetical protein